MHCHHVAQSGLAVHGDGGSPVFTGVSRPPIDSRSGVSRRADSAGPRASSSGWVGGGLTGRPSGMVPIGACAVPVRDI